MTPRLTLTFDPQGGITRICADRPIDVFFVCPHVPHDRVYQYGSVEIGPEHVRAEIGGYAVGHAGDGTLTDGGPVSPKLPPVGAGLRVVGDADDE